MNFSRKPSGPVTEDRHGVSPAPYLSCAAALRSMATSSSNLSTSSLKKCSMLINGHPQMVYGRFSTSHSHIVPISFRNLQIIKESFEEFFVEAGKQRISPDLALEFYRNWVYESDLVVACHGSARVSLGKSRVGVIHDPRFCWWRSPASSRGWERGRAIRKYCWMWHRICIVNLV